MSTASVSKLIGATLSMGGFTVLIWASDSPKSRPEPPPVTEGDPLCNQPPGGGGGGCPECPPDFGERSYDPT